MMRANTFHIQIDGMLTRSYVGTFNTRSIRLELILIDLREIMYQYPILPAEWLIISPLWAISNELLRANL